MDPLGVTNLPPHETQNSAGDRDTRHNCMWITCVTVEDMSKMIQIRHVPEELHRTLKARAAMAGMSLSDYLLAELRRVAERPSRSELRARLERSEPVELDISLADLLAEERNRR